jgi:peptidoglycan/xylan/chitin deacetylase (PgdA/CDA1 family)
VGSVPYGDIWDCTVKGDIALTFDDGPDVYTDGMVNLLNRYNAKATFFITGINNGKGAIDTTAAWSSVIKKMHDTGHQLASHTWSHADLSTLTEANRRAEMYKLEMAMRNIVGFFPTYMRPPYSSCNAACTQTMNALGYHIVYFDLDTDDYNQATPAKIQVAKNNFANAVNPSNPANDAFLAIAHDIHQTTAQNLTEFMLQTLTAKGYRAVTVGECLGDPKANWYRTGGTGTTPPPSSTTPPPSSTTIPPPASTSNCAYKVGTWCASPLPTYNTVDGCWNTVGNCWNQGDQCWFTVNSNDCIKYQDVCRAQEAHCEQCVASGSQSCPFLNPVYA